ncbi:MAG: excinuclease ABC subunit UvrA [Candidatus Thermoplasmatota archaeon]|jgi:excinuclease ABC subunit A|nr:excinuclease ABC subunit UvrA [Candidatus Thermoplasmatota archaeon]
MSGGNIVIKGARQHNLKNIDVTIPRDKLITITGLSGSGKSSLAFDTIYAEGQRRFIESLSSYARNFLGVMDKPDVDSIEGLSPAISIEQHSASKNPRSTVGTSTEVHDHLRLLFARIGVPHCPVCSREIERQSQDRMIQTIMEDGPRKVKVLCPIAQGKKGTQREVLDDLRKQGYNKVRIDGVETDLSSVPELDKNRKHDIMVVLDELMVDEEHRDQLTEDISQSLHLSEGLVAIEELEGRKKGEREHFSERMSCPVHGISIPDLEPRMFSFNTPFGACKECSGIGFTLDVDPELVVPNKDLSISQGAVALFRTDPDGSYSLKLIEGLGHSMGFSVNDPWKDLPPTAVNAILYGSDSTYNVRITTPRYDWSHNVKYEGVVPVIKRRFHQTQSEMARDFYRKFLRSNPCPSCGGARLKPTSLAVTVGDMNIHELTQLSIKDSLAFFERLSSSLSQRDSTISRLILKEVRARLGFLSNVGLDYLTLDRPTGTLSGGEAQRIQLATQIGSSLVGVLYVLDEPSIGLHQRDNRRLIDTLIKLRDLGNTIIVVEHDEMVMRSSDHILDLGPGAGQHGGELVAQGTIDDICYAERSMTGLYLSGKRSIPVPTARRKGNGHKLVIRAPRENNLKGMDVAIPLGTFTCITGVSGSGKSTLVDEVLHKALMKHLHGSTEPPGRHEGIDGLEHLDKVIVIDQSPIGRTPRSNPATYTGAFTPIRDLFTGTSMAKARGYKAGQFSFNVKGGRCENCEGDGIIKLEMHFLPDVYIPCEVCQGKRYTNETLEVRFKGKNIAEVLDMSVEEAMEFFKNIPVIGRKLRTLWEVGLGYIKLGQPATTLSGGEAQRVKLATELSKRATGRTIYLLDEPTTGLHFDDVNKLLNVLQRLREKGNTVVVIEHNLDVIKTSDWVIDLGPEGGDEGGEVVSEGTPETVSRSKNSYTGRYLREALKRTSLHR